MKEYVTVKEFSAKYNLNRGTTQRKAREAGALITISKRCVRVDVEAFWEYYKNKSGM